MIKDENYNEIANAAYDVDKKKSKDPYRKGDIVKIKKTSQDYKVLKASDDPDGNGISSHVCSAH